MSRNKYTPEFKAKIVLEVLEGDRELGEIAADNNLNPNMVRTWKADFIKNAKRVFNESQSEKEIRRKEAELEQERSQMLKTIGQLTMERDFLHKPIEPEPEAVELKEAIMAEMDRIHTKHPYMGQRKIVKKLEEAGFKVGRKLVRNYMQQMGIFPIYPKPNLSKRNFKEGIMPYLLRNMNIYMPNQVWSIDITFIKMLHGHMYLTAIIDWYSRKIVGWNLSDTLDTVHVINAVLKAVEEYGVPAIINSDQGSQFTSNEYKELLKSLNIRQSMDGKSRWADNIMIERWFRTLKYDEVYLTQYKNIKEAREAIRAYIKTYNFERCHSAINNQFPAEVYYPALLYDAAKEAS